jgi:hypothetical protein
VDGHKKTMTYVKNPQVDTYIEQMPPWQQAFASRVRDIVHSADPEVSEVIKRSVQPYFVLGGNICAFLTARDHLNVFIYDPIAPDPDHVINQGHGNLTARAIQLYQKDALNEKALLDLFKAIIKNNRAGGWRKLTK